MRRTILVAIVAFISTAPIAAAVFQQLVTPAEAEQQLVQAAPQPAPSLVAPSKAVAQSVIQGQIDAFRHGDGAMAYSYAAPNIRTVFPTPGQFMTMVQSAYAPVYRPRSIQFGALELTNGSWIQSVQVIGPDGEYYTAAYSLAMQPDGSWKITGCMLIKTPGSSA